MRTTQRVDRPERKSSPLLQLFIETLDRHGWEGLIPLMFTDNFDQLGIAELSALQEKVLATPGESQELALSLLLAKLQINQ